MNKHMPCIVKSKSRHVTAAFDDDHSRDKVAADQL